MITDQWECVIINLDHGYHICESLGVTRNMSEVCMLEKYTCMIYEDYCTEDLESRYGEERKKVTFGKNTNWIMKIKLE